MSKKLFIVESPNKCGKLRAILGEDYIVKASVGHVREIPKEGLNIDVEKGFEPTFAIMKGKADIVKDIKTVGKDVDEIILATDLDREGESISYHLYDMFTADLKKKCTRVTFNEITKKAVLASLDNKRKIDMNLVMSQKARQVLDRLIGYKISPLLWTGVRKGTSAGRVQSIALKYVAEREKEIMAFKSEDFWNIEVLLANKQDESFYAEVITPNKENRFLKKDEASKVKEKLVGDKYKVVDKESKIKSEKPNPPFDTASLQKTASAMWGWAATKTAKIAQDLYAGGKCTYIRTDSFDISPEAIEEARNYINKTYDKSFLPTKPNIYHKGDASQSQGAHECIRPTHVEEIPTDISGDDLKLYLLIRDRFLACQMSDAKTSMVTYKIKSSSGYDLISKGQSIVFKGFLEVYDYRNNKDVILPNVAVDELLKYNDIKLKDGQTKPPPRYKEGSLIEKLEKEGVGRPSTYASILDTIQQREYVEKVKNGGGSLQATELGMMVCDYLNPKFDDFFMDTHFTASLEKDLDLIEMGKKNYLEVVSKVYEFMMSKIGTVSKDKKPISNSGVKCPVCGAGDIVEKLGKFGKFFTCSGYPNCKTVFSKNDDGTFVQKTYEKKEVVDSGVKCPTCKKGKLLGRTNKKDGSKFYGCSNYPKCKFITKDLKK